MLSKIRSLSANEVPRRQCRTSPGTGTGRKRAPCRSWILFPKGPDPAGRKQMGDPVCGADTVTTLCDLTIEEIKFLEFLDLIRALPADRRRGLLEMLHLVVERQRSHGDGLEWALDG